MKILLIEDDVRISTYIKKGLEIKSHVVDKVDDGLVGYELAADGNYDVIILDRMLPSLDGIEICKKLRMENINTPILMLTAKTQIQDRVEGLNSGADDYLVKPFAFDELIARLNALNRRPLNVNKEKLKIIDLEIDTQNFEVKRANAKINLSKKEYQLLEFLVRNRGKVFSPEQITEQVWNYDSDVLPNTAQVYIGYLRNKIDKKFPNSKALIKTIRGFGYKIE